MYQVIHTRRIGLKGDEKHLKHDLAHNAGENIDWENPPDWVNKDWKPDNLYHWGCPSEEALKKRNAILEGLARKPQKNAAKAIEVNVSAGDGFPQDKWADYFAAARKFFCNRYGEENLISDAIHTHESTPHMHLIFVPIVTYVKKDGTQERRYAASDFLEDGCLVKEGQGTSAKVAGKNRLKLKKDQMTMMHTDFYEQVGKEFGLERGEIGSRASHVDLQEYHRREKKYLRELEEKDRQARDLETAMIEGTAKMNKAKEEFTEQQNYLLGELKHREQSLEKKEKDLENRKNELDNRDAELSVREGNLTRKEIEISKKLKELERCEASMNENEDYIHAEACKWSAMNARGNGRAYRPENPSRLILAMQDFINGTKSKINRLEIQQKNQETTQTIDNTIGR